MQSSVFHSEGPTIPTEVGNLDNPGYIHLTDEAKRELGYVPRVCYTPGLIPRVLQLIVPGGPVIYVEMKHLVKPETWYDPKKFALKVTEDNEYAHYDVSAETGIEGSCGSIHGCI